MAVNEKLVLEDVELIFKNFSGEKQKFNNEGDRNFSILIENPGLAEELHGLGWNIRELKVREEGDDQKWHLPIKISYAGKYPPSIYQVKENGKLFLTEDTVAMLDWMPIKTADVVLNPYNWTVNGESGTKAYLQTLYAVIDESELDLKYAEVPDIL